VGRPHRLPEYRRRIPGIPILGKFTVRRDIPPIPPPLVDPTDFSSDKYGGFGSTTEVEFFPGESDPIQIEFRPDNDLLRADARSRLSGRRGNRPAREPAVVLQAVSNRRRAEVAAGRVGTFGGGPVPGLGSSVVPVGVGSGTGAAGDLGAGTFAALETAGPVPGVRLVSPTFEATIEALAAPIISVPLERVTTEGHLGLPVITGASEAEVENVPTRQVSPAYYSDPIQLAAPAPSATLNLFPTRSRKEDD